MYTVILTIYCESMKRKEIKKKEKKIFSGPFDSFSSAQSYMDEEMAKHIKIIKSNGLLFESESNDRHDRVSLGINMPFYYKCYDYHIKKTD